MNPTSYNISSDELYQKYFSSLLAGDRWQCTSIILDSINKKSIKTIYKEFFQKSLYTIGELWEHNAISVAAEHIATAITEGIMNQIYPQVIAKKRIGKKIVISCLEDEFHQVGGKMVSDIFEMHGWDAYYLGANTPTNELIRFIHDIQPNAVGLSLSVYFHIHTLIKTIHNIRNEFPNLTILVGGQAFRYLNPSDISFFDKVIYLRDIDELERYIISHSSEDGGSDG